MDLRKRILIVEDDDDIALSLKYNLEKEGGYVVATAGDGDAGLRAASQRPPDLVILDLNLPGMDGLSLCKAIRRGAATSNVPIMMLTARIEESDKIVGLEIGADDYVTKPFSMREILARTRAILRRRERVGEDADVYADDLIHLDPASHILRVDGKEVSLTRKEFDLLAALVKNRGRVLNRDQLLQRVWGHEYFGETRTVDVHIRRLRKKLGKPAQDRIETIVGVGYRFRISE
jgi:two-component system, OmpR family, alkaline phosphatase synthesis response regulator PhoP